MSPLRRRCADEGGQMAVEMAVVMPVVIIIAVIVVNAMTFFSECASFDRVGRNAVRIYAASPAYGQDLDQSIAEVGTALDKATTPPEREQLGFGEHERARLYDVRAEAHLSADVVRPRAEKRRVRSLASRHEPFDVDHRRSVQAGNAAMTDERRGEAMGRKTAALRPARARGARKAADVQVRRARKAVVLVSAFVLFAVAICLYSQSARAPSPAQGDATLQDGSYAKALASSVFSGVDVRDGLLDAGFESLEAATAPDWFAEEVMPLDDVADGVATPDFSTVGFSAEGGIDDVLERLTTLFAERGWRGYDSGMDGTATYMKEEGECSWMMATCTGTGESTSVVLRIRHT